MTESQQDSVERVAAFRFGAFELRPASHELLQDGQAVVLQPKVFDFIAYLVVNRSRLVDKNELLDAVWPRQVVTDAALSRCVMKARRALNEDAENPRAVHTVHGRGFRFVAPVEIVQDDGDTGPASAGSDMEAVSVVPEEGIGEVVPDTRSAPARSLQPAAASRRRIFVFSAWVALALIAALALVWLLQKPGQADKVGAPMRVAILPMANETGDSRHDWARLGLMTAIDEILRVEGPVQVMAAHTVVELDGKESDPAILDRQLREVHGVTHIVRGRIQENADQLRLDYRVLEPGGGDRRRTVVAADISSLAHAAGADLRIALGLTGVRAEVTPDSFANEAYLRGRALRLQGDVEGSQRYYVLAMEQAPGEFWPRYEHALGLRDLGKIKPAEDQLLVLLEEADANGSPRQGSAVRNALAIISWRSGDLDSAATYLDEAYAMSRNLDEPDRSAALLINLGILAKNRDQLDAARDYLNQAAAYELASGKEKPSGHVMHSLGQVELKLGDLESAGRHFQSAMDRFTLVGDRRSAAISRNSLADLRWRQGRATEARSLYEEALEQHRELGNRSSEASALLGLGAIEVEDGKLSRARVHAETARQISEELGEMPKLFDACSLQATIAEAQEDYESARSWRMKALEGARALDESDSILRERLLLATLDGHTGHAADAEQEALQVVAEAEAGKWVMIEVDALLLLARLRGEAGARDAAIARLEAALARVDKVGDPRRQARVHLALAHARLAADDPAGAAVALSQAEPVLGTTQDFLKSRAMLAASRGEAASALADELAAKAAAGERWTASDEQRLIERRQAVP